MSEPKHDPYEAYGQLPFPVSQALRAYEFSAEQRGAACCLEDQAFCRERERPYDQARKTEHEMARGVAAQRLDVVIQVRDELARAILAALAEAKKR